MTDMSPELNSIATTPDIDVRPGAVVSFFKHDGPYGCFANFAPYPITIAGRTWPTVEHFFQAQKFLGTDPTSYEAVASAPTPKDAAAIGRDRSRPIRADWDLVKDSVMRLAVITKLLAYPKIQRLLLDTGNSEIVEASPKDSYWGTGADGKGKNMLGIILMEAREIFRTGGPLAAESYASSMLATIASATTSPEAPHQPL